MLLPLVISHSGKIALTVICIAAVVLIVLWLLLGVVFFMIALGSKKRKDETIPCKNSLFERNASNIHLKNGYRWYDENYKQDVTIKSRKGKPLHATEFRNPSNSNVWVVTIHGWTNVKREQSSYAMEFYRRGFNVLIPDLRGHDHSESNFVSMGWLDRLEIVDWINSIAAENPKVRIIIHGVSMGAATTMMTTGEELPANVVLAISDCGYTSVKDIFVDQCIRKYHLPPKLVMTSATIINKIVNGFFFGQASSVNQLRKSKTPTLFIHGDKDNFVLPENLDKVYQACAAPKAKYIVHGAEHAVSSHWYHEEYWHVIDAFLEEYLYASPVQKDR